MGQRIDSRSRSARLDVFLKSAWIRVLLCGFLLPGLGAQSTSCIDSESGNNQNGGDAGLDAWVDLGPIDCLGGKPHPELVCTKGQMYDFESNEPIGVPLGYRITSYVETGDYVDRLNDPGLNRASIRQDGKFATWSNLSEYGPTNNFVLVPDSGIPEYLDGVVNHYAVPPDSATYFMPDFRARVYLISLDTLTKWDQSEYPLFSFMFFRPLFIGLAAKVDYTPPNGGEYTWLPDDTRYETGELFWQNLAFDVNRGFFVSGFSDMRGPTPAGGAVLIALDPDEDGDVQHLEFRFMQNQQEFDSSPMWAKGEWIDAGLLNITIVHDIWPEIE